MTKEEASKLKPGDRVLIEATIRGCDKCAIDNDGDVRISLEVLGGTKTDWAHIKPEAIREKISPPRRAFRKGDIVKLKDTCSLALYYVSADEIVGSRGICLDTGRRFAEVPASDIELVCSVDDRKDRKEEM